MSKRIIRDRRLTPEEAAKYRKIRDEIEREKPAVNAAIRAQVAKLAELEDVFVELKKLREEQGLSLADIQEKTGIDRSQLSKLETGVRTNYTLDTILRYAEAVGKRVLFRLADQH